MEQKNALQISFLQKMFFFPLFFHNFLQEKAVAARKECAIRALGDLVKYLKEEGGDVNSN